MLCMVDFADHRKLEYFTKAGEAGWKSLIPIYGDYVSYKIAWQTSYFWLNFILGILLSYVSNANLNESMFLSLIVILLKIALTVINIHVLRKTCKSIRTWYWICDRTHLITANLLTDSWLWL